MSKCLVTLNADWADEFECQQFLIVDSRRKAQDLIDCAIDQGGYFGTNEGWEEHELSARNFKIVEIDDEFADKLKQFLGKSFGVGILDNF